MATGKRQSSATEETSAKKAKVLMDPFEAEITPVLELLQLADLPKSCKNMLKAAALPCLRTGKDNRHEYQEKILDAFSSVFANTEAGKLADVNQMKEQLADLTKEHGEAKTAADAAQECEKEAKDKSDALGKLVSDAQNCVQMAKQACEAEQKLYADLSKTGEQRATDKDGVEKVVSELFKPLEAYDVAGSNWRVRNKMNKELVQHLQPFGIEESLASALPLAMKEKVAQRGEFAQQAIKFASDLLTERIETLSKEKADLDAQATEQHQKIDAAQAEVKKAEDTLKACEEDHCTGQNEWLEAHTSANTGAATLKSFEPRFEEVNTLLEAAKERLASFSASMEKFATLKDRNVSANPQVTAQAEAAETRATEEMTS